MKKISFAGTINLSILVTCLIVASITKDKVTNNQLAIIILSVGLILYIRSYYKE